MTRNSFIALLFAAALPLVAQQPAPAAGSAAPAPAQAASAVDPDAIVATINGETITRAKLDQLWERAGTRMRSQYEKNGGGKLGFLDNYIKKRLVLQEAYKKSFQEQPYVQAELEAARESALFDLYVRDVIAAQLITDQVMEDFYEEHKEEFLLPARAKVRHILIKGEGRTRDEARARLSQVMQELLPFQMAAAKGEQGGKEILAFRFAEAAKKHSEDDGTKDNGGDLGWMLRERLDAKFAEVVFSIQPGIMSGIVETQFGQHLILVEAREEQTIEPFENARSAIREFIMAQEAAKVLEQVGRLSNDLRRNSKVALFPENVQ
jgi:peptidyl-prolyl cis-trans isomerase C